jgi:acyl dehydratase
MSVLEQIEAYKIYFETIDVGAKFETPGRTITEADIVAFAGLSGDYNALHTDAEYAAGTQHKQRIAHGLLVLSIMSGLSTRLPFMKAMEKTLIGLANLQCRWRKPSFIGDTLHIELEVIEKKPSHKPDRGTVILSRKAIDQNGEVVLESEWSLVLKRETAAV